MPNVTSIAYLILIKPFNNEELGTLSILDSTLANVISEIRVLAGLMIPERNYSIISPKASPLLM